MHKSQRSLVLVSDSINSAYALVFKNDNCYHAGDPFVKYALL